MNRPENGCRFLLMVSPEASKGKPRFSIRKEYNGHQRQGGLLLQQTRPSLLSRAHLNAGSRLSRPAFLSTGSAKEVLRCCFYFRGTI